MIVRLRTRDGTEKVTVEDSATVAVLRSVIEQQFKVPDGDQTLSLDQNLLLAPDVSRFTDLGNRHASLKALGVEHGSLVYLRYTVEREVTRTKGLETRPFGEHMTVAQMMLKQTRIERQDKPECTSLSFDGQAANVFQSYVNQALAFNIQRCGFLYGECDESGNVKAHFIYEPPQQGFADRVDIAEDDGGEQRRVDIIAEHLGMKRVGWIFSASTAAERDCILSSSEILAMARLQAQSGDPYFATAVVSIWSDEEGAHSVHFEAFQCSKQAVQLFSDGWFVPSDDPKFVATSPDKEVAIVAGRDTRKIENEFLVTVVPIMDHSGPLTTTFPVENRLTGQTVDELRACMNAAKSKPYAQRLADFHMLLFLSQRLGESDVALLCDAVRTGGEVAEGYRILIDSLAGLR